MCMGGSSLDYDFKIINKNYETLTTKTYKSM